MTKNRQKNKKWVTFSYLGNQICAITKLLKSTNVKVAFGTMNTFRNIPKEKPQPLNIEHIGIYI
jgi:hypothetical protein